MTRKTQYDYDKKSRAKLGRVSKNFVFDTSTADLLHRLKLHMGLSQIDVLRQAMQLLAQQQGLAVDVSHNGEAD